MLFYPAGLPLSSQTLHYTAGVIRRHRRRIGSCWRKLNPGRQALLVPAYLRKDETFADLAAAFSICASAAAEGAADAPREAASGELVVTVSSAPVARAGPCASASARAACRAAVRDEDGPEHPRWRL
jgi:hypothetical protein